MSDTMQGPPAQELSPGPHDGSGSSRRRLLIVVVVVAGVLVLGAATYFLFLSGGSSDEEFAPVTRGTPAATPDNGKKSGGQSNGGDKVPQKVDQDVAVGTDPFEPLAAEAPVVSAAPVATDPADPTGTGDPAADAGVYQLTVKSVNLEKDTANIDIDGKLYTVKAGNTFPSLTQGPFLLVRVDASQTGQGLARVIFGSDTPVVMKVGNTVTYTTG